VQSAVNELKKNGEEPITKEQGEDMCKQIGALKYLECSAKTQEGLAAVFEEAVRFVSCLWFRFCRSNPLLLDASSTLSQSQATSLLLVRTQGRQRLTLRAVRVTKKIKKTAFSARC
jgi:hypothetical protein